MDKTPIDEMLGNLIVKLHARRDHGPGDLHADMHALAIVLGDTRGLLLAHLRRQPADADERIARVAVERDIAMRERDDAVYARDVARHNAEQLEQALAAAQEAHAARVSRLSLVLQHAQTALYDAMHAGHLSREYAGGVIRKIEAALKERADG